MFIRGHLRDVITQQRSLLKIIKFCNKCRRSLLTIGTELFQYCVDSALLPTPVVDKVEEAKLVTCAMADTDDGVNILLSCLRHYEVDSIVLYCSQGFTAYGMITELNAEWFLENNTTYGNWYMVPNLGIGNTA